jgi:hypothetical protein
MMLKLLPDPARTIVAVAAFVGLSRSEIRGLEWPDHTGDRISVVRSVWESVVSETKTRARKAPVPVIVADAAAPGPIHAHERTPGIRRRARKRPMASMQPGSRSHG